MFAERHRDYRKGETIIMTKNNSEAKSVHNEVSAQAYIEGGKIHWLYSSPYFEKVGINAKLGKDLIDFIWLDEQLVNEIFTLLNMKYIEKKDNPDIAGVLIEFARPFANKNAYLTYFLMDVITTLATPDLDGELLEVVAKTYGANTESEIKEFADVYSGDDIKAMAIKKLSEYISVLQNIIEKDINLLFDENKKLAGLDPKQKLFILNNSKDFELDYLSASFSSSINTDYDMRNLLAEEKSGKLINAIKKQNIKFTEMYDFDSVEEMLCFEMVQAALAEVKVKRCEHCGKYFIPSGRADSVYCDRIMPGETEPCKKIGAGRKRDEKVNATPAAKLYTAALKRMSKRKASGSLSKKEFRKWNLEATQKRDDCLYEKISLPEYEAWLNKSSRSR
jgi:hypothetical protein